MKRSCLTSDVFAHVKSHEGWMRRMQVGDIVLLISPSCVWCMNVVVTRPSFLHTNVFGE